MTTPQEEQPVTIRTEPRTGRLQTTMPTLARQAADEIADPQQLGHRTAETTS